MRPSLYIKGTMIFSCKKKIAEDEKRIRENTIAKKKIKELEAFVNRFKAKATKARQAQSRVKQIEKIEVPKLLKSSRKYPKINFEFDENSVKRVLLVENIEKNFNKANVLNNISFEIRRGEKTAVIGPNGIGKSTLLNILTGLIKADKGNFYWGDRAKVGYFAQDFSDLNGKDSIYSYLSASR